VPEPGDDSPSTGAGEAAFDLVITGGTVIDGTGADRFTADVGIRDGRVVDVAREGGLSGQGAEEIDAAGLIVSPGFIDHHNHVQNQVHRRPLAENFIRQGITTILPSLHSGDQPYPLRDYIEDLDVAPNIGFFAGHTWTRRQVLGMEDRAPTPEELDEMRDLVRETMEDGALGLSTGLLYVPANYAETEEVIELAKVAAEYGGIYYTHMRDEARGLLPAVREAIRIGAEGGLPVHINHFKAMGVDSWGKTIESLALVDSARAAGIDVKVDVYPYTAGSTGSGVLFPQWVLAGGVDSFRIRVTDPETRARMEPEIKEWMRRDWTGGDLSRIQFRTLRAFPEYNGRRMSDLAADRGLPNNDATGVQLAIELQLAGGFSAIYHFMDETDVIRIMRHPQAMFETDGDPVGYGARLPASAELRHLPAHPRPLRAGDGRAHAGGGDPEDDVDVHGRNRPVRARPDRPRHVGGHHRLRRRPHHRPRRLRGPAPLLGRHPPRDRERRPRHPRRLGHGRKAGPGAEGPRPPPHRNPRRIARAEAAASRRGRTPGRPSAGPVPSRASAGPTCRRPRAAGGRRCRRSSSPPRPAR